MNQPRHPDIDITKSTIKTPPNLSKKMLLFASNSTFSLSLFITHPIATTGCSQEVGSPRIKSSKVATTITENE